MQAIRKNLKIRKIIFVDTEDVCANNTDRLIRLASMVIVDE